ncbi:hypothetical protein WJX72_003327 [[Myrmecia] bisecta]|uniref:Uncharacterized protein n=1 Tax=[Myrmecia] bisecta TaxID=41462 RepID=A0AAW1P9N7_9CHLO
MDVEKEWLVEREAFVKKYGRPPSPHPREGPGRPDSVQGHGAVAFNPGGGPDDQEVDQLCQELVLQTVIVETMAPYAVSVRMATRAIAVTVTPLTMQQTKEFLQGHCPVSLKKMIIIKEQVPRLDLLDQQSHQLLDVTKRSSTYDHFSPH